MEKLPTYTGYRSYEYLEEDAETLSFALSAEVDRVPKHDLGLSAAEEQQADALLKDSIVVSLHDHPVVYPQDLSEVGRYNRTGRQHTGYLGLSQSGMTAVFDNMMDGTACVTGRAPWRWDDIVTDLGMRQADIAHQDCVIVGRSLSDIYDAHRTGRIALIFGLESASPIENEIDRLDVLYGLGLRQMGIVYSDSNALGSGLKEQRDGGLTAFGHRAVERMNRLGMAIDVSHASDLTSLDVCAASAQPVLITHAGARAVWDSPRMKPDSVLKAVADTGGVIGMSAAPHTTLSHAHPLHSIDAVMDHFEYCADLVGIDHVAFGPDTMYADHVGFHTEFAHLLRGSTPQGPDFDRVPYVSGLESPTENFRNIIGWLVGHGYSDKEIRAVVGGNILRALSAIWV